MVTSIQTNKEMDHIIHI